MQTMNRITKQILKMKFFENLSQNMVNFDKKYIFTKMRFIQNNIFRYNLSQNGARDLKFGECMQKKITKNLQGAEF